jgi:hypothetical protein
MHEVCILYDVGELWGSRGVRKQKGPDANIRAFSMRNKSLERLAYWPSVLM